jgi:aspergillopepsin I
MKGYQWKVKYGSGEQVTGGVYTDKVRIGGLEVPKQAVQAAVTLAGRSISQNKYMDGILGMGFSGLNQVRPKKVLTWFDNVRGQLAQPLFVSILKRNAPGSFDFGFLDKKKYVGDIAWVGVNSSKGFWDFKVEGFGVGNGAIKRTNTYNIIDTGSSLWFMPQELVRDYYNKVPGARGPPATNMASLTGWTVPCNATMPDITLVVSGKRVSVPGKNVIYQPMGRGSKTCIGGLQVKANYMPFNLFGDIFLKGMYVVFEHKPGGQPRIGVARATS